MTRTRKRSVKREGRISIRWWSNSKAAQGVSAAYGIVRDSDALFRVWENPASQLLLALFSWPLG